MRNFINFLFRNRFNNRLYSPRSFSAHKNHEKQGVVRYQFHMPGIKNYHLLPFKSKLQGSLNIFKPYWNKTMNKTIR